MRGSWISYIQTDPGRRLFAAVLAALAVLCALASLCLGPVNLSPLDAVLSLMGRGDRTLRQIVLLARLPRTCGCLLAGAALAVAGAVIQGVMDNPLAAPNIIGVNSGAGLAVTLCCALAPTAVALVPFAAFLGALAGVLLVLFIGQRTGAARITLVLAGVAVSSIFSACTDAVVNLVPEALSGYSDFRIGGLKNLYMARIVPAFWVIAIALPIILSLAKDLDLLRLGAEQAQALGLPARSRRIVLLSLAAALAGAAVSIAGLLGFVGLIVPHILRRLLGEESLPLLLSCAFGGAAFLTACDLLSRLLFAPYELPVGIVLSLVGGPFFIWLLLRQRGGIGMIELKGLCAGYPGHAVLYDVSLTFRPGQVLALIGPNGCGKSTLLKAASGLLPRAGGQVLLDGAPLERYKPRQIAQRVAYLPQSRAVPNITARRMVLHGRFPYLSYPRQYRHEDYAAVDKALAWADAADLADVPLPRLSGGQRQKVYLAMALAQDARTILMDEPTAWLDVRHQLEVMDVARRLAGEGRAVVLVLHDLCMALQCADQVAVLADGRPVRAGPPEEIYHSGALEQVMGVTLRRVETELGWRYYYLR